MGIIMKQGIEYTGSDKTLETALIYSTEEREVGVWTDGKPLYQKTLYYNEHLYGNVDKDVASLNIDTCVDISGMTGGHSQYDYCTTFGYARETSSANVTAIYNNRSKKLQLRFGSDYSSSAYFNGCNITLFYTKTTDTAGSGTWTTTGEYAHHYSTTEHVIGTWIDGKPLYEKTIELPSPIALPANTWTTVADVSSLNIDALISTAGKPSQSQSALFYGYVDGNSLKVNMPITWQIISVTIQYTKTTD